MESVTDALANEGSADAAPCITVATLHVATRSRLVAWYYRTILYRKIFQTLDGHAKAQIALHDLKVVSFETNQGRGRQRSTVPVFAVSVTTTRFDEIGEAEAAMHALSMQNVVSTIHGKRIKMPSLVATTGSAFKRPRFEDETSEKAIPA